MKARVLIAGAIVLAACAHAGLDRADSRGAHEAGVSVSEVPVRGFHVDVEGAFETVSGELIAVDPGYIHVNVAEDDQQLKMVPVPREHVRAAYVAVRASAAGGLGAWTGMGCASTVSHGGFLVFSGPIWLVTGITSTVAESDASKAEALQGDLDQLYQYARFPQGLPESWGGPRRARPSVAPAPVLAPPAPVPVPALTPSVSSEPSTAPASSAPTPAATPPASASAGGTFPPTP